MEVRRRERRDGIVLFVFCFDMMIISLHKAWEFAGYIALMHVLDGDVLVTCVCVLIGARELWRYPWLLYQAFGEAKTAATRASSSGSGSWLKTHVCCRSGTKSSHLDGRDVLLRLFDPNSGTLLSLC
jgi:hypothetical protein